MLTLPIVEHLDVFEDVLLGFVSGDIRSLVYQLTLERPEETFDARVVPAVAFATHTGDEAILRESPLVARGGSQGGFKWSSQHILCWPIGATGQAPLQAFSNPAFFEAWR